MTASLPKLSVNQLSLYNPTRMSDEEIVASFAARQDLFDRILADIQTEKPLGRPQHHLIVGQRGMGKSTLLARLAAELRADPRLAAQFIPLAFAEEQYAVDRLSKFWMNCLDSLADASERAGDNAATERIDEAVRRLSASLAGQTARDEGPAEAALEAFLAEARAVGKRPVLLVDNLQLVFERISDQQAHVLRELLMRQGAPLLVGASPSPPPQSQDYGAAFYDHFKVHYLRPLSVEEMLDLLLQLAQKVDRPDIRRNVLLHPHRLSVLRQLTGGNPRTTVTLFFLYAEDFAPAVFGDLENLLDRVTPLYKARFEELSPQQQVIASAVGNHWDPVTTRGLAEATSLPVSAITPNLDRLEKVGFVERVELFGESSIGFQIAERFFNVWFLMRSASRRQRREVEFLTRFIESFYEAKDRVRLARQLQTEHELSPDRHLLTRALASTLSAADAHDLRRHAELDALRQRESPARRRLEEVIDFSRLPATALAFDELRERLVRLVPAESGVTPGEFRRKVLGDREMFRTGYRSRLAAMNQLSADQVEKLAARLDSARETEAARFGQKAVEWLAQRLESGQLASPDSLEDWTTAFCQAPDPNSVALLLRTLPPSIGPSLSPDVVRRLQRDMEPGAEKPALGWFNWGYALHRKLGRGEEAEAAYRQAIVLDKNFALPWNGLGNLLANQFGRHEEAEAAYRQAIALDQTFAWPWHNLGCLLHYQLNRYEEAEAAYRQAVALDEKSAWPWLGLGDVLHYRLSRYEEAEAAYRQAIAMGEEFALPWSGLGDLLQYCLNRYEEAEAAYRQAIARDEKDPQPWNNLGALLQDLGRYEEAEAAYRQAIALDKESAWPWNNLGNLLQDLGRYEEAEAAYRQAIALDKRSAWPWNNLGCLLQNHLHRYEEAEAAYRQAIALGGKFALPWGNLGSLLQFHLRRYEEAEAAYREALARDPKQVTILLNLGNLCADFLHKYDDAESAFVKALEEDPECEDAIHGLIWLRRDFRGDVQAAAPLIERLSRLEKLEGRNLYHLHRGVSAAYESNWGTACQELGNALQMATNGIPADAADGWMCASAVLLHLNYGEQFLAFLRARGDHARLRPWYEALAALHAGDRRKLQNVAPEVRTVAEAHYDQIESWLNRLPEKTRRRPVPAPRKRRAGGRKRRRSA